KESIGADPVVPEVLFVVVTNGEECIDEAINCRNKEALCHPHMGRPMMHQFAVAHHQRREPSALGPEEPLKRNTLGVAVHLHDVWPVCREPLRKLLAVEVPEVELLNVLRVRKELALVA